MPIRSIAIFFACSGLPLAVLAGAASAVAAPTSPLSAADRAAIFKAAGFTRQGTQWKSDCGDPGTPSYEPGTVEAKGDLNGDGLPEALVTEGGAYCYGNTGTAFWLLSRQAAGAWRLVHHEVGIADILPTRGVGGWPDIAVGGPGFCFPVLRYNGKAYARHRFAYEGKPCRP